MASHRIDKIMFYDSPKGFSIIMYICLWFDSFWSKKAFWCNIRTLRSQRYIVGQNATISSRNYRLMYSAQWLSFKNKYECLPREKPSSFKNWRRYNANLWLKTIIIGNLRSHNFIIDLLFLLRWKCSVDSSILQEMTTVVYFWYSLIANISPVYSPNNLWARFDFVSLVVKEALEHWLEQY